MDLQIIASLLRVQSEYYHHTPASMFARLRCVASTTHRTLDKTLCSTIINHLPPYLKKYKSGSARVTTRLRIYLGSVEREKIAFNTGAKRFRRYHRFTVVHGQNTLVDSLLALKKVTSVAVPSL